MPEIAPCGRKAAIRARLFGHKIRCQSGLPFEDPATPNRLFLRRQKVRNTSVRTSRRSAGIDVCQTHPSLPYTQQATLEELAGVAKNRRFDDSIEDEELEDIDVVCRKLNSDAKDEADKFIEIPLAKPARAFYFGDRIRIRRLPARGSMRWVAVEAW